MNIGPNPSALTELQRQARNMLFVGVVTALTLGGLGIYAMANHAAGQLWSVLPIFIVSLISIWLSMRSGHIIASIALITGVALQMVMTPLFEGGLGVPSAILSSAMIGIIGLLSMPRQRIGRLLMVSLITGMAIILLDVLLPASRPVANTIAVRWTLALIVFLAFVLLFAREFFTLDIRTKIVLGILATGGVSLVVLALFAFYRAGETIETLSGRLETSVGLLAEEQLINTVFTQASLTNEAFEDIMAEVASLSEYWVSLQDNHQALSQGSYWDASTSLVKLAGGQYGSSSEDVSSVFIPANSVLNDALYANLNTSSYLDLYAPGILKANPALLAVYAIDTKGVIRYYPNIDLASILPPDFDATERPYYRIASPLFNPERLPRWSIPYVDAAGAGLVVTVAAPVYVEDEFQGVAAADMTMENITAQIRTIKIGQTGYSFMIDSAGGIISMPPAGYALFDIRPEDLSPEEFFAQTILGKGSYELQSITRRMVAGGRGLLNVRINGVDTYLSFAPVEATGYSIALVVPAEELQGAILTAHAETQQQIQSAVRLAALIFFALLLAAISISMSIGQIIAAPIIRLTRTAEQIIGGNLSAQAKITSQDEIGTLAQAFNTMTSRLRQILEELERRVADRTSELALANEKIERRARQFEAIAEVANTISSTRDMDSLLPQIATAISKQFGFYHVGIFLLDPRGDYAVLSAANSEGGHKMLARNHKLKVGETGIVGFVTGTGKPRVALNTGEDVVFFDNPDLPETRSEMALPLRVGEEIIGALDVQSTVPNAFDQEDINILTTLADQVSIAIQNARQYEATREALAEANSLSRQFVQAGWQQFTHSQKLIGIRHSGARATLLYGESEGNKSGDNSNRYPAASEVNGETLAVPIKLRGEVIGSVNIQAPENRKWEPDELDIVTAIIERAALALENARLLQESQSRAAKEAKIGEVTARISSSIHIRNVLQTAVQELGQALPGSEVIIQFDQNENKG
ncbi:MAG TPA: GAF domain-containing protein [Anaerolineales bacterium]|nr:GAF domain-containing protein [Anaerolineales bacterium]